GLLTGSYAYSNCTVAAAASCTFDEQTIPHGTNVTAYQKDSVSFGSSCVSQQRTCSNGLLTGSYTNPSCVVEGASSCTFNGNTIQSGYSVTAYQSSTVPFGNTCSSQSRTCTNGSLSGTYSFASCSVSPAATCSFNGQTIAHDGIVTAYEESSVDFGSECQSEVKTCSNGTLSGSYTNSSCVVAAAASCTFNEQTVAHGNSVTAYLAESVAYGSSCTSEGRSCSNGTLSGTYTNSSCSIEDQISWTGVKQFGTSRDGTFSGSDVGYGIATDTNGNVYITGYTTGNLDGNTHAGTGWESMDLFVAKYDSGGIKQWVQQLGSSGLGVLGNDEGFDIATDSVGNIYVTGQTYGGLDGNTSSGDFDLFVVKYNSSGVKQWTQQLGSSGTDRGYGISVDSSGNVYVTGHTSDGLDGNTSYGSYDLFLVKFNKEGTKQWTRQLGSSSWEQGNGVTTDANGNVFVTGSASGSVDGNSHWGSDDLLVVKFDSNGTKQWVRQFGTSANDYGYGITSDSSGNVFVTGYTDGALDGNTNAGSNDIFIIKYTSAGTKQWTQLLGTSGDEYGYGIAADPSGNVYVTGYTEGNLEGSNNAGGNDVFVVKYNSSGGKQWTQLLGTSSGDFGYDIASDSDSNVYVTGPTLGGFAGNANSGSYDVFIIKYDSDGNLQ
ncbi:MAG: SBBP repeat-containing protein, partial [Proteobacteria bacterium]|nr:SBBP repeat-containing protein [Pseudomonadota bacterium]